MNSQNDDHLFNKHDNKEPKILIEAKKYSQAYFTSDHNFHYFTYNDESDFLGGYSTVGITNSNYSIIDGVSIKNHNYSPIEFLNEVKINKINFIPGTQYAYYNISDLNTNKIYYGIMDIKENKVLFNTDEIITTFVPYSNTEMLAITPQSAYKICIIKKNGECSQTCSSGKIILDIEGNKCGSDCDEGKIKLRPNDACINSNLCDENIFVKNSTHCGLCKEFYPNDNKYKLLNTSGCISYIPNNSIQYNSNAYLKIYKCKINYHPDNNHTCIADFCFPNCDTCYEPSNDTNNQMCITCKNQFYFDSSTSNCIPCSNSRCEKCTKESNAKELCTKCLSAYETVNITTLNSEFFYCFEKSEIPKKFFKDENNVYKPCYRKCKSCLKEGNDEQNNCLECNSGLMFRPEFNPYNNCVADSENVFINTYGNVINLPNPNCPEEAKYKIKENNSNKIVCVTDCKKSIKNHYLFNGNCLEKCTNGTSYDNINKICKVDKNFCSLGNNDVYLEREDDMKLVETLAKAYASEFHYTHNHISVHNHKNFSIILYKNVSCIQEQSMRMPTIDFLNCSQLVKEKYNVTELVAAVADKKTTKNPTSFYGFYHPISGIKLDSDILCNSSSVQIKENLYVLLNENSKDYFLQINLTKQGINIFDIDHEFFNDICFEFDNPLSRDISLQDRQKDVFPNVTLCDNGCHNQGIDLNEMTATCDCKYRDISQSNLEVLIEEIFGDAFEFINSSNLEVLRCYKNFFKYFPKSIGGIILLILIITDITFSVLFIFLELTKLKKYVLTLTDNYLICLKESEKKRVKWNYPPKKESDNNSEVKFIQSNHHKKDENYNADKYKRPITIVTSKDNVVIFKNKEKKENKEVNKADITKDEKKLKKKKKKVYTYLNLNDEKMDKKFFEEYLSRSVDDMEFDDAIVMDDRKYIEILCDILKDKQMIMNTFIQYDPLKTRFIKIILFILNICLYLVVNGLFFGEEYINELYNLEKEDNFFSFFPRSIDKLIYSTIVSMVITYITDFFFIEEKKIMGLFRREKNNRHAIKEYIIMFLKDLQTRYISFMAMAFVILIFSFYYLICFNRVYPKTQIEWIKSSIVIMIIVQIISVIKCFYEASARFLSFKFKSQRLFKASKLFD